MTSAWCMCGYTCGGCCGGDEGITWWNESGCEERCEVVDEQMKKGEEHKWKCEVALSAAFEQRPLLAGANPGVIEIHRHSQHTALEGTLVLDSGVSDGVTSYGF